MDLSMSGKVALVTGAASGIGRATALAFAAEGAAVVVSDVDDAGGEQTVSQIRDTGGTATYIHADVSNASDVAALVNDAVLHYGRLDYAFNNAGIEGQTAPTAEATDANWDRVIAIDLSGTFYCMREEMKQMLKQGAGAIVNCSSVAGLIGFAGSSAYVASKHGVIGLTKTGALEGANAGIRVNAVCPGVIATPMVDRVTGKAAEVEASMANMQPMGRMGTPAEIAAAVVWLCSDAASFVTGIAMPVDGGFVTP